MISTAAIPSSTMACTDGELPGRRAAVQSEVDDLAPAWSRVDDNQEQHRGEDGQHQIRDRTGQGDEVLVAADFGEVAADDRSWFRPANQDSAEEC